MADLAKRFIEAIKDKSRMGFYYNDTARLVCPHLLGESAKGLVVMAFQLNDTCDSGAWRFFYLDKIQQDGGVFVFPNRKWYPDPLAKSEDQQPYVPPKFITKVLALAAS